jgi:Ulp1 family protease
MALTAFATSLGVHLGCGFCRVVRNTDSSQVGFFNTFFYDAALKKGWEAIKKWTRKGDKMDVFSKKLVFVPSK